MYLDLSCNRLTDVSALSGMTKLRKLYLGGNQLTDVAPLAGLKLDHLYLSGNPLAEKEV